MIYESGLVGVVIRNASDIKPICITNCLHGHFCSLVHYDDSEGGPYFLKCSILLVAWSVWWQLTRSERGCEVAVQTFVITKIAKHTAQINPKLVKAQRFLIQ